MRARELDVRAMTWTAAAIAATVALSVGAVLLLLRVWHVAPGADRLQMPYQGSVAGPALQSAPQPALAVERTAKERQLTTSGWVDATHGIVRIPIETAMRLRVAAGASAPERGRSP
jgi:hypothetical protein